MSNVALPDNLNEILFAAAVEAEARAHLAILKRQEADLAEKGARSAADEAVGTMKAVFKLAGLDPAKYGVELDKEAKRVVVKPLAAPQPNSGDEPSDR